MPAWNRFFFTCWKKYFNMGTPAHTHHVYQTSLLLHSELKSCSYDPLKSLFNPTQGYVCFIYLGRWGSWIWSLRHYLPSEIFTELLGCNYSSLKFNSQNIPNYEKKNKRTASQKSNTPGHDAAEHWIPPHWSPPLTRVLEVNKKGTHTYDMYLFQNVRMFYKIGKSVTLP